MRTGSHGAGAARQRGRAGCGALRRLGASLSLAPIAVPEPHGSFPIPPQEADRRVEVTVPRRTPLIAWVDEIAELTKPDAVLLVRRLRRGVRPLCQVLVDGGHVPQAHDAKRPNSYLAWSDPATSRASRTARSSAPSARRTPGPTNNWQRPGGDAREARRRCSTARCAGRTMYVVPFSMGPLGSDKSHVGVQLTDSPYVAVSMRIMTRMGQARARRARRGRRVRARACTRVGAPLEDGPGRRAVAVQRGASTSSTSPRRARSGPSARATAATRCSARSASRCASPR